MNRSLLAMSICVLAGLSAFSSVGCGPAYEGPQRASVSGSVTFAGTGVKKGTLNLFPVGHNGRAVSVPIINGSFLIEQIDGPNFGEYRVEILAYEAVDQPPQKSGDLADVPQQDGEKQVIPEKYNKDTELELDVSQPQIRKDFNLTP